MKKGYTIFRKFAIVFRLKFERTSPVYCGFSIHFFLPENVQEFDFLNKHLNRKLKYSRKQGKMYSIAQKLKKVITKGLIVNKHFGLKLRWKARKNVLLCTDLRAHKIKISQN